MLDVSSGERTAVVTDGVYADVVVCRTLLLFVVAVDNELVICDETTCLIDLVFDADLVVFNAPFVILIVIPAFITFTFKFLRVVCVVFDADGRRVAFCIILRVVDAFAGVLIFFFTPTVDEVAPVVVLCV